jgi:RNA polymerase sigma-70 factor (ECF subfamily)
LTRIAINDALMHLRRTKHERKHVVDIEQVPGDSEIESPVAPEYGVRDLNLEGVLDRKTLARAISHLPPDYRTVLVLRLVEGLSTEETCTALHLDVTVVKSRLFRARLMMRTWLVQKKAVKA